MKRIRGAILILLCAVVLAVLCAVSASAEDGVLTLPGGTAVIEAEAFAGLTGAQQIELPATVTEIGAGAFRNCGDPAAPLRYYFPPAGVSVGAEAFEGCRAAIMLNGTELPRLSYSVSGDGVTITGMSGQPTEVVIPAAIEGKPVVAIGNNAFNGKSAMTRVVIPSTVTSIGQNAFRSCTALTQINFPAGLKAIGQEAFRNACVNQAANAIYVLPDSVQTFGSNAFYNCGAGLLVAKGSTQEDFVKENGYTFAYDAADGFRYQYKKSSNAYSLYLTGYEGAGGSVAIPAGPAVIGESAFANNTAVTAVTIPNGVTAIETSAFRYCTNLTSVTMADSVTTVSERAFAYCEKLTDLAFSASLTTIKGDAFYGACTVAGAHIYNLPDSVSEIGGSSFNNSNIVLCVKRGSVTEGVVRNNSTSNGQQYTHYGETDFRYRWYSSEGERLMQYTGSAATVTIPAYVWLIDDSAFRGNTAIRKVVIPEGVTRIGNNAFRDCANLTDITLPDSLTRFMDNVFYGCGANAEEPFPLYLADNIGEVGLGVFTDCPAIRLCGIDSATADTLSGRGWSFARNDRPNELDIRYKYGYVNNVRMPKLYDYVGPLSSVRLPDDCANVDGEVLRAKVNNGLELVCGQLSDTALGLSNAELTFTFPGHEGLRYRIIDNVLCLMGWVNPGSELIVPPVQDYIDAGWDEHVRRHSFRDMTALTRLVLPEGMVCVEDSAFCGCVNLTDVSFPSTLKVLENHAFEQCGKNAATLHYYVLPDNMTSISTNTGAGWGAFTDINMGRISCAADSATALIISGIVDFNPNGSYRFALKGHETDGLLYHYDRFTVNDETVPRLVLKAYEGSGIEVAIPSDTGLYRIEESVFQDRSTLQKVVIPEGVVEIGAYAFDGCTLLHTGAETNAIYVPDTVRTIGDCAFRNVGAGYAERFYLVLPGNLEAFDISAINGCNAVFVVSGGVAATALYNNWYYYYPTLEDAIARTNCHYRIEYDAQGNVIPHAHYGKR